MAYDRYDTRPGSRGEPGRWSDDRERGRGGRGEREERGFFERAGEQISSWFGDDDDDRDERRFREERGHREFGGERERYRAQSPSFRRDEQREPSYRPTTGDYGRSGVSRDRDFDRDFDRDRGRSDWDRDEYRRTSFAGSSDRSNHPDPHYHSWRERQMADLDRDYEEYRREHQAKFESDFGNWRSQRQTKRQMLGQIREHMEVFGNDEQRVGTVDRVAGDRIILTKNDPEAGGVHHSLTCTEIDRVENNRVILGCSAEQAKQRWRDEDKSRALFEREDQGEAGPHMLDRSFSGTYR